MAKPIKRPKTKVPNLKPRGTSQKRVERTLTDDDLAQVSGGMPIRGNHIDDDPLTGTESGD